MKKMDTKENTKIEGCPIHGGATSIKSSGTTDRELVAK